MPNRLLQDSFETIEGISKSAVKQVKKSASDTAVAVAGDVRSQMTGRDAAAGIEQGKSNQPLDPGAQKSIADENKKVLDQTRQNLERINAQIKRAREDRLKAESQKEQKQEAEKREKQEEVHKKQKEETVLSRLLLSKQGSREANQRTGG